MAELPRQSNSGDERYSVTVVGASCEHRWPGTVTLTAPHTFALDRDDGTCPECGENAGMVLFGNGWDDGTALTG